MELLEKFGIATTADFREALKRREIEAAKNWLQYIIDNKDRFPQYQASRDSWLADRQREIAKVEEK